MVRATRLAEFSRVTYLVPRAKSTGERLCSACYLVCHPKSDVARWNGAASTRPGRETHPGHSERVVLQERVVSPNFSFAGQSLGNLAHACSAPALPPTSLPRDKGVTPTMGHLTSCPTTRPPPTKTIAVALHGFHPDPVSATPTWSQPGDSIAHSRQQHQTNSAARNAATSL